MGRTEQVISTVYLNFNGKPRLHCKIRSGNRRSDG
ncbi:MAG: hypothetical protein KDA75_01775 [Planctomycetaceae bacterium]|nr:hypothetical protein [Planctomycetaceae bacterium]